MSPTPDEQKAAEHYLKGGWVLASSKHRRLVHVGEYASAFEALRAKSPNKAERVLLEAMRYAEHLARAKLCELSETMHLTPETFEAFRRLTHEQEES